MSISDSRFHSNESRGVAGTGNATNLRGAGGAIYQVGGELFIAGTRFEANVVDVGHTQFTDDGLAGGAIYAAGLAATVHDGQFLSNRAGRIGGAVFGYNADLTFIGTTFSANSAGAFGTDGSTGPIGGGAIYAAGTTTSYLEVGASRFVRNRAVGVENNSTDRRFVGGAIASMLAVELTVRATEFLGNVAEDTGLTALNDGGAVYFGGGQGVGAPNPPTISMNSVAFVGNVVRGGYTTGATEVGGLAIRDSGASQSVRYATFYGNQRTDDSGTTVYSDLAFAGSEYTLGNSVFFSNQGFDPPANPSAAIAVLENNVGPFSEFDGAGGGGNVNDSPPVEGAPDEGADNTWGTADDRYSGLAPWLYVPYPGSPGAPDGYLVDRGDSTAVGPDSLDVDADGDTTETLPLDAGGNPRVSGSGPDIGAYERQ